MAVTALTGDRTTAWAAHLRTLGVPKHEAERAYLLAAGETAGGNDLTTLLSRLLAQGNAAGVVASPLLDDLVSYWSFDAGWTDLVGTNHLTNVNGVTAVAGKLGQAGDFEKDSSQQLTHADAAPVLDEDFTYALWYKREDLTGGVFYVLLSKGGFNSYWLVINDGNQVEFSFNVRDVRALTADALNTDWHFVVAWHDAAANTINVQRDNGTVVSTATGGVNPTTGGGGAVAIGFGTGFYFDGLIDDVALWRRVLTVEERTALYNNGNGLAYPF